METYGINFQLSFFLNIYIFGYEFPSEHCFNCLPLRWYVTSPIAISSHASRFLCEFWCDLWFRGKWHKSKWLGFSSCIYIFFCFSLSGYFFPFLSFVRLVLFPAYFHGGLRICPWVIPVPWNVLRFVLWVGTGQYYGALCTLMTGCGPGCRRVQRSGSPVN